MTLNVATQKTLTFKTPSSSRVCSQFEGLLTDVQWGRMSWVWVQHCVKTVIVTDVLQSLLKYVAAIPPKSKVFCTIST
jgi:hypothetical protein